MGRSDGQKVAVITGGASGLGRALAVALGYQAWTVVLADVDVEGAEETLKQARAKGGDGAVHRVDVRDPEALEALAEAVFDQWGRCDLLINNAGVAATGEIGKVTLEDWRWCMDIDLYGVIHGCHAFVPRLRRQGHGHILNIASVAGYAQGARMAPYNVAKAGVIALSETLRAELLGTEIGVTVACPGFFNTNIAANMRATSDIEKKKTHKLVDKASLKPEAVASALLEAVWRNQPIIVLPLQARFIYWLRRMFPARASEIIFQLLVKKNVPKREMRAEA